MRLVELPSTAVEAVLERLRADRRALSDRLARHEAECIAAAPHGYFICQLQYKKIADEMERIDARIASLQQ